jgi:hypothetical protein
MGFRSLQLDKSGEQKERKPSRVKKYSGMLQDISAEWQRTPSFELSSSEQ